MRIGKIVGLGVLGALTAAAYVVTKDYHMWQSQRNGQYNHPSRKLFMSDEDAMRDLMQPRRDAPQESINGS